MGENNKSVCGYNSLIVKIHTIKWRTWENMDIAKTVKSTLTTRGNQRSRIVKAKKRNGTIRVSGQSKQCKIITHLSCRVDSGPDGPHTISLRFGGDRRRLSTSDTDRLHESARIIEHHYAQ